MLATWDGFRQTRWEEELEYREYTVQQTQNILEFVRYVS